MKYKVIVSDRTKEQLVQHIAFIANTDKNSANKTKNRIIAALRSLSEMPHRYPLFDEEYIARNKYHKMYVENWYLVLYQIVDNTVYVECILDCRQDYQWLIK